MTVLRAALAFVVLLVPAGHGRAGTGRVENGVIIFTGTVGGENVALGYDAAGHYVESDSGVQLGGPGACTPNGRNRADCTGVSFDVSLSAPGSLLDASDVDSGATLRAAGRPRIRRSAGDHRERLIAGNDGDDNLTGLAGNDTPQRPAGANTFNDGPGDDTAVGGPHSDTFNVDVGRDVLQPGDGYDIDHLPPRGRRDDHARWRRG